MDYTTLALGIFLGIVVGVLGYKYILPWFDINLEVYNYKKSVDATDYQLTSQAYLAEFKRDYPETEENYQQKEPCIGFHHPQSEVEELDYEEYECDGNCKCKSKNSIGFKC